MKNRKIKGAAVAAVAVIMIVTVCCGWLFLRVHNGVRLQPVKENIGIGTVPLYRQDDPQWAGDTLGASEYTMASSGCLVSCIAAAVSEEEQAVTPGQLNVLFSANGVYDSAGNLQWAKLDALEDYQVTVYDNVEQEDIDRCLAEGHYPIVRVRMHGIGNYHFVLIVGTEDGEYVCMDPLAKEFTVLSDYAGLVYAVRCVWME